MGVFKFKDKTSEDFGLVVQTPPTYSYPERDVTVTHIPGRDGDIIIDNKSFKNVDRSYLVGLKYPFSSGYYDNFQEILNWLESSKGEYAILEDSYDSEVYRYASFQSSGDTTDYFGQAGAMTIKFNCKPQRFLKYGNKETKYSGQTFEIENASTYTSLPVITIDEINTTIDSILMMSVTNNNIAKSILTFSDYNYKTNGSLVIDSEKQTVKNQNGEDCYTNISLNGKEFPKLYEGNNVFKFGKYNIVSSQIPTYQSKILDAQTSCISEYKTYTALEQLNQNKIFVKSYDTMITLLDESYLAESVQSHIINSKACEEYTFGSFNSLLNSFGEAYGFTGGASDNAGMTPDWLTLEDKDNDDTVVVAKVSTSLVNGGFFIVTNAEKKIHYVNPGETIKELKKSSLNTIYYYPATPNKELDVHYSDIPDWLSITISYSNSDDKSPSSVSFNRCAKGYYWKDKVGTFDKAKWEYAAEANTVEMAKLTWSTLKSAFVPTSSLSLSTTKTFTFRHLPEEYTKDNLPAYEPVTSDTENDDGTTSSKVINAVHFKVVDTKMDLTELTVLPLEKGYYKLVPDGKEISSVKWQKVTNTNVPLVNSPIDGTKSFGVLYFPFKEGTEVADIDYRKKIDNWPEWLDPTPVDSSGNNQLTSLENYPNVIYFKVLKDGYYRLSKTAEDDTGESHLDDWGNKISAGTIIPIGTTNAKGPKDAFYIYEMDDKVKAFDHNRSYTIEAPGTKPLTTDVPPDFLTVEHYKDATSKEDRIKFSAKVAGYYKWESNDAWIYFGEGSTRAVGDEIINIGEKDDVRFYYMASLPSYSNSDIDDKYLKGRFLINVVTDVTTGNPKELSYKIIEPGYYKVNNGINWEYYAKDSTLTTAKITETTFVYGLKEVDFTDEIVTKVKPRWWKL